MVFRLFGGKPLSETMLPYCQLDPVDLILVKLWNSEDLIQGNVIKNGVCEMAAILSRPQCVNRWSGIRSLITSVSQEKCNHILLRLLPYHSQIMDHMISE